MTDDLAARHRRRIQRVENAPGWGADMDGAKAAMIVRHVGTYRRFDREARIGVRVVEDDVDAARALRRRTGEIDEDILVGDFDRAAHDNRLFESIAPRFVCPFAVRELANFRPHRRLGTANDLIGDAIDRLEREFIHHFQKRSPAGFIACGLGIKIADDFVRLAHVGANDLHQHAIRLAGLEQFHDRNAQSFFENLPRFRRKNSPADIRAMASIGE